MRRHALLGFALLAGLSNANPYMHIRRYNSSSLLPWGSVSSLDSSTESLTSSSPTLGSSTTRTSSVSSTSFSTSFSSESTSYSTSSSFSSSESTLHSTSYSSSSSSQSTSDYSTSLNSTASPSTTWNSTSPTNGSIPTPTLCTGCVLEALNPTSTYFIEEQESTSWTSLVVTETMLYETITYMDNGVIDTIVTETKTLNQTKTVIGAANQTITHTTPSFTWEPYYGTTLTLAAGPTYVAYLNFYGGLDFNPEQPATTESWDQSLPTATATAEPTCDNLVEYLQVHPGVEVVQQLIITYTDGSPELPTDVPLPIPSEMIEVLKQDPSILEAFSGSDIGTCTLRETSVSTTEAASAFTSTRNYASAIRSTGKAPPKPPPKTSPPHHPHEETQITPEPTPHPYPTLGTFLTTPTSTYLSTTYESTSTHITKKGCLRCSTPVDIPPVGPTEKIVQPTEQQVPDPPQPTGDDKPKPNINPNPGNTNGPMQRPKAEQTITVGDNPVVIKPAQPTGNGVAKTASPGQNEQNQNNILFGTQTLTPGQVITTDGVVVSVPSNGGGSSIVVGGSTIAVNQNPGQTPPPALTVGENTFTANSEGEIVIGFQTLTPGGSAITVDGTTLSLGPSGTIAVVNGVTQTIGNGPVTTGPPEITVNGQTVSATVIGGSTAFVIAPGQTLTPGGILTVDGTTFSMPSDGSGSTVVVNGVTSTLNAQVNPILTVDGQQFTATVVDGTTQFVLGFQTLTPGGVVTVDGTTFSLPADGSGSTIVVNGETSTLSAGLPVLTLSDDAATATVIDGTTAFIFGPGETLTPGGVITVSGTTISMPASASGSVIVINGVTSTLAQVPITEAPPLTIDGKTYSATVHDGTTEYVLGEGTTLKPGEAITIDGTTYSLDSQGTELVINGKTSSIPRLPASNSATTTKSASKSASTSNSARSLSSTTTTTAVRAPGNFIASGVGVTEKEGRAIGKGNGLDKWAEGLVMGAAGWLLMFL